MITVTVQRQPADSEGSVIVDPMIATVGMARRRGIGHINETATDFKEIQGTCARRPYMRPGSVVLYTDRHGDQHRAVLMRSPNTLDRNGDEFSAKTDLVLRYKTERIR